jgi:murein DD-endopeptidase MepM/ murein hydrolase activator NlpD
MPADRDGFVLVYALQPNRRYEAVEAFYQSRRYTIAQLYNIAKEWLATREKSETTDGYRYFQPDVDQWGVIRRDGGYVAATEILPANASRLASGITIRMSAQTTLPHFEQVELTLDPNPGDKSSWISFDQYQSERASRSNIPEVLRQNFRNWKNNLSEESGFQSWTFYEGMLFLDRMEWWGTKSRRRTEHEGIDFAMGKNAEGISPIPSGTPVRAIANGEVVAVLKDFLGKTVIAQHPTVRDESNIFYTLYSHIQPVAELPSQVSQGQILGRIGETRSSGAPMHIHLTAAWIPESIFPGALTMDHINHAFSPIILVNLNSFLEQE